MRRNEWFYGQRITNQEMIEVDDKTEQADRNIVKEILGHGVFGGPSPTPNSPADLTVLLPLLLGYDQLGRRCELPLSQVPYSQDCSIDENAASTAVVNPGNSKIITLFLEFDRILSDPRTDDNGTTVYWEQDEWFKINVVQSAEAVTPVAPPNRSDQIRLADLTRAFGQTTFTTPNISTLNREDFALTQFLHGATHRENGPDPVPNATPSDGGIMSGADKTKVDGITWTGPGVSVLLGFIGRAYQPTNVVIPPALLVDVTAIMVAHGSPAGGSPTQKGIITGAPDNYVKIFDTNKDSFLDPSGDKVYGRITESGGSWTLSFFVFDQGVGETPFDMTPFSGGPSFLWYVQEVFSLDSFPVADPMFAVQSDQVAGEIPDATTTQKGKVQLATDGEVAASKAVQGDDSRLLPVNALTVIRKLASRPSLVFMREDGSSFSDYALHSFHGLAHGKYPGGNPDYYFELDPQHADYPLHMRCQANPATAGLIIPGPPSDYWGSDNTSPIPATTTRQWLYAYIIGRDPSLGAPQYALVFSSNPPSTGPDLSDGAYAFATNGWLYWRFVGCILNLADGLGNDWEMAQLRKIGNHVTYELERLVAEYSAADTGLVPLDLSAFVPPSSVRADIGLKVSVEAANIWLGIRPRTGGSLGLQEVAQPAPPAIPRFEEWQMRVEQTEGSGAAVALNNVRGWIDLDSDRYVEIQEVHSPGANEIGWVSVHGWEEFTDHANGEFTW